MGRGGAGGGGGREEQEGGEADRRRANDRVQKRTYARTRFFEHIKKVRDSFVFEKPRRKKRKRVEEEEVRMEVRN